MVTKRYLAALRKKYPKFYWDDEARPHCKKCGSFISIEGFPGGPYFFMHYAKCVPKGVA